jgi:hypothetical protein
MTTLNEAIGVLQETIKEPAREARKKELQIIIPHLLNELNCLLEEADDIGVAVNITVKRHTECNQERGACHLEIGDI